MFQPSFHEKREGIPFRNGGVRAGHALLTLRLCESYGIRAERENGTATVEEKDRPAWTLVTCTSSTHALPL